MSKVLIADGDRASQELLVPLLSKDNYQIELVTRGEEVLQQISAGGVDVVITEVHLPDVPAWDLIPRIHQLDSGILIIAITADDSWETSRRVRIEGGPVFFYGLKPLNLWEMHQVVRSAMNWRQKLCLDTGKVMRNGG